MLISKSLPILSLTPVILKSFWSIYSRWEWTGNLLYRLNWKFSWDLNNSISGGNWLFGGTVFSGGTFYPSANYVIFIMAYWYRRPYSGTQKKKIYISLHWNFPFHAVSSIKTNKNLFWSKKIYLSYFQPF